MGNDQIQMELEQRLQEDPDNALLNDILTRLAAMQDRLRVERKKMQRKQTFVQIEAAEQSVQAALMSLALFSANKK